MRGVRRLPEEISKEEISMRGISLILMMILTASPTISSQMLEKKPDETQIVKELIGLDQRLIDATRRKDKAALESIYADEFILVNPRGEVWDKKRNIDFLLSEGLTFEAMTAEGHSVEVFGETAHMFHLGSAKGVRNGKAFSGQGRTFHIFVRRNGRWQLLVTHEGVGKHK